MEITGLDQTRYNGTRVLRNVPAKAKHIILDKSTEAILELEQLQERRDMVIAGPLANIYAHERAKLVDYEAISAWKAKLDIAVANTNLTEKAQIFAALFYWHTDRISDAQQVLKTVLQSNGSSNAAYALMGWIDLTSNTKSISMKSISWFEKALDRNPKDLEVIRVTISLFSYALRISVALYLMYMIGTVRKNAVCSTRTKTTFSCTGSDESNHCLFSCMHRTIDRTYEHPTGNGRMGSSG